MMVALFRGWAKDYAVYSQFEDLSHRHWTEAVA